MSTTPVFHYAEIRSGVEEGLQWFEESLDKAGYVPYVSTVTGGVRIFYGQLQIILGVALAILLRVGSLWSTERRWTDESMRAFDLFVHGAANVFRGAVECFRWVNLVCLLFDRFAEAERDKLRLRYEPPILFINHLRNVHG